MKFTEELAEAFTIFSKYGDCEVEPSYDGIASGPEGRDTSEEDAKRLKELGWRTGGDFPNWFLNF